jgi:hypothetical protein
MPVARRRRAFRRRVLIIAAAAAAAGLLALLTLPPRAHVLARPDWAATRVDVAGAYHIHTVLSDGSGTIADVAAAAAREGLRFVIITDHGDGTRILPPAYRDSVLCIDAVEVSTTGGHYVALGLAPTPYPLGGEPRDVVADVARLGGFGVVAHPYSPKRALQWDAWNLPFDGIEWMNADSERREAGVWQLASAAAHYPFRPPETIAALFRRPVSNLTRWDTLTRNRRVVGLAGADAHARIGWGGTERQGGITVAPLPSYQASFGAFSIHADLGRPLSGNAVDDARAVLEAVEAGHVYTSLDGLEHPAAFTFSAHSGARDAMQGDDLVLNGPVILRARVNDPYARLVLFRNGIPIAETVGGDATFHEPASPAVYRVEARRQEPAGAPALPWIVGNPIYVLASPRRKQAIGPPAAIVSSETLSGDSPGAWRAEHAPASVIELTPAARGMTADDQTLQLAFSLGTDARSSSYVAAVHEAPADLAGFDHLAFRASASRPLRLSLQLRDTSGRRWQRSVYIDPVARTIVVPFADMRPVGDDSIDAPDLATVRSILFVVDLTNALPGASGTIWLWEIRAAR